MAWGAIPWRKCGLSTKCAHKCAFKFPIAKKPIPSNLKPDYHELDIMNTIAKFTICLYFNIPQQGGDLVPTMPGCVCPKLKDMGSFSASRE